MKSVHYRSTEKFDGEFDFVRERDRLARLANVPGVEVHIVVADQQWAATRNGVAARVLPLEPLDAARPAEERRVLGTGRALASFWASVIVRYQRRNGEIRDYEVLRRFYHADRVAEMVRLDMEAA